MSHTELPWEFTPTEKAETGLDVFIFSGDKQVAWSYTEANAAFIVKAVNNHYQLLEAAKHCFEVFKHQADRGDYPLELFQGSNNKDFMGKAGWQFLEEAIKAAEEE